MLGVNLAADIQAVFDSYPASAHDAAVGLAQAYFDYVALAQFGPDVCLPVQLTTARDAMAATLEAALNPITGLAVTAANAFQAGVTAFWLAPPMVCIVAPGAVNACPGASSIAGGMTPVFLNLANTSASAATGMAAPLMSATTTTTAIINLPPPTTFPIS